MKHNQLKEDFKFFKEPEEFDKDMEGALRKYCPGSMLYMLGTNLLCRHVTRRAGLICELING